MSDAPKVEATNSKAQLSSSTSVARNGDYEKAKTVLTAPVVAADNFFESLKSFPIFSLSDKDTISGNAPKEKVVEPKMKDSSIKNTEYEQAKAVLTAPVIAADNFFKSLKSSSFFAPADKVSIPKAENLSNDLTQSNVKYETTRALLNSPVVAVASTRIIASSRSLDVVATQKNLTASLSTNAGIFPESGKVQPGAQATASLSKFVFDYGQTDRQLKLAALETQASILSTHATLNTELTKLLSNFIVLEGANKSLQVIDAYLSKYKKREQTIRTAVSAGVLSRTDLLEIEAAKNDIDSQYERLKLTKSRSQEFLITYLGDQFSKVNREIFARLVPAYELEYTQKNVSLDLIAVRQIALETEIEIAQNFDRYRINANASLSSPSPINDSFSTFAGFSITKPLLDGGQSPATIEKKKADLEVLVQEIKALELERDLIISSWEIYKKYHLLDGEFLEERKDILLNKSIELEGRFKAGQVGVVSLASAILTSAQAEVDIIQHQTELVQKKLEAASALTQPCALINICEDIQQLFITE
ncbi:TolC family protein [Rhodobacteraceae bacterium]|nr:TolC family protein [Paracoccaceae bacterium]